MSGKPVLCKDPRRMHHQALLGIICDFLDWGGTAQTEQAEQVLDEVARRIKKRKNEVKPNEKILAVVS